MTSPKLSATKSILRHTNGQRDKPRQTNLFLFFPYDYNKTRTYRHNTDTITSSFYLPPYRITRHYITTDINTANTFPTTGIERHPFTRIKDT